MADRKLTQSSELATLADGDLAMVVDVSDTTDGVSGTNKKVTISNLRTEMQEGVSTTMADLTDVDDTGKVTNKILKYNEVTSKWEVADDSDTTYTAVDFDIKDLADSTNKRTSWDAKLDDITGESIGDLLDVDTAGVAADKILKYNGTSTNWEVADAGGATYTHPNHTGDVTSVGDGETTIADGAVTLAKMADLPTGNIIGRVSAATGVPEDLTAEQVRTLLNVEDGADVTDTANVTGAGALMDSEVDEDLKTFALPASTTISVFGASLVDDIDAAAARATLGVDPAGTDNSTDVTVTDSAEIDFTLTGQDLTASIVAGSIDESKLDVSTNASLDLADSALQSIADESITEPKLAMNDAPADGEVIAWNGTGSYMEWAAQSGGGGGGASEAYTAVVDVNGTGDYTTLGAALTANETDIFVKVGTYVESAITSAANNVTIRGEDMEKTILSFGADIDLRIDHEGWHVSNLTYNSADGARIYFSTSSSDTTFEDVHFIREGTFTDWEQVVVSQGKCKFNHCFFDFPVAGGNGFDSSAVITHVTNCLFKVNASDQRQINMIGSQSTFTNNIVLVYSGTASSTAELANFQSCHVEGNLFAPVDEVLYSVEKFKINFSNCNIIGNRFVSIRYPVNISTLGTVNIIGNMFNCRMGTYGAIYSTATSPNWAPRVIISNNYFHDNYGGGRHTINGRFSKLTISNNNFYKCGLGTSYIQAAGITITGNVASDYTTDFDLFASGFRSYSYFYGANIANNYSSDSGDINTKTSMREIGGTGLSLEFGDVVVREATSPSKVVTTTTAGDYAVIGVVQESGSTGDDVFVQEEGLLYYVKVDGTVDIAIGDYLCTSTTAGVAEKAGTGDTAFAIATQAYSTDDANGTIEALLIKPMKL